MLLFGFTSKLSPREGLYAHSLLGKGFQRLRLRERGEWSRPIQEALQSWPLFSVAASISPGPSREPYEVHLRTLQLGGSSWGDECIGSSLHRPRVLPWVLTSFVWVLPHLSVGSLRQGTWAKRAKASLELVTAAAAGERTGMGVPRGPAVSTRAAWFSPWLSPELSYSSVGAPCCLVTISRS